MPALQVGSITFPVAAGRIPKRYEDTATYRRRWDGTLDMEARGPFGRVRVWSPTSIPMTTTNAANLIADLLDAGTVEVSGDSVGSTQTCYVRNPRQQRSNVGEQRVVVQCELVGVDG